MKSQQSILVIILILMLMHTSLEGQDKVNYQSRYVIKTLVKEGLNGYSDLEELLTPENLISGSHIEGKFFRTKSNISQFQYMYIGRVNSCRTGGCSFSDNPDATGDSEYFDYLILFDKERNVNKVRIFSYQATHGHEVCSHGWLKQFEGYDGSKTLLPGKDIDAISGATISVHGITSDIVEKTVLLRQIITYTASAKN